MSTTLSLETTEIRRRGDAAKQQLVAELAAFVYSKQENKLPRENAQMSMDKKNGKIGALAITLALSASAYADTGGKAMQAHTEASKDAAVTARADATARGFEADMAKMTSEMDMSSKAAKAASSANGVHGRVLGLDRMKMLMAKKNEDGTFTVGHVSGDKDSVKEFIDAKPKSQVAEEE